MQYLERKHGVRAAEMSQVLFSYQRHDFGSTKTSTLAFEPWYLPYTSSEHEPRPTAFDLLLDLKETSSAFIGTVNVRHGNFGGVPTLQIVKTFRRALDIFSGDLSGRLSSASIGSL
jgi:hypothetical protein